MRVAHERRLQNKMKEILNELQERKDSRDSLVSQLSPITPAEKVETNTPLEEWIDSTDVMRALKISGRTLQTLRTNGTIPYAKLGRKVLYRKRDLERVLDDSFTMWRLKNPMGYGETRKN